uniref:Uncharacterized protein n=1 Tax=Rhizophora mucronata TaxID=61149 RepID=A0A2P2QFU2_RHIMU
MLRSCCLCINIFSFCMSHMSVVEYCVQSFYPNNLSITEVIIWHNFRWTAQSLFYLQ